MYFENNIGMKKDGCSLFLNYSKTKNIEFLEELIDNVYNREVGVYPSKHIDQIEPRIRKIKWLSSSVETYSAYNNWLKEYRKDFTVALMVSILVPEDFLFTIDAENIILLLSNSTKLLPLINNMITPPEIFIFEKKGDDISYIKQEYWHICTINNHSIYHREEEEKYEFDNDDFYTEHIFWICEL